MALGLVLVAVAPSVHATAPELQIVSDTTYEVRPAERLIHVIVDGSATSYTPDSSDYTYYYRDVRLVILGGATDFSASAAGSRADVTVLDSKERQMVVGVALNREVHYRQSATFHLEFDLPTGVDGGDVRVGANVAAFPVWAVGSSETAGSTISLALPAGFQLVVEGADLPAPTLLDGGGQSYAWTDIPDPDAFGFFATADLSTVTESTYRDVASTVGVGGIEVEIVVRSWADDPDWEARTSNRITAALPLLGDLIGVDYLGTRRLTVLETVSRTIDGYAGIFDNSRAIDEIQVAFDATDAVTLHEAAHAWFNASLSSDRWILEGFASYYGTAAAEELGVDPDVFELTDALREAAFPLADWDNPGIESEDRELYAYAASQLAADALADRAGRDGLTAGLRAMAADEAAYQPLQADEPEVSYSHAGNWHYLLDLLEERTGRTYDDIFREWVVPPADRDLLDERAVARSAYRRLIGQLGAWELPRSLRRQMAAWSFDSADATISDAQQVIRDRTRLGVQGGHLGIAVPLEDVRAAFENGDLASAADLEGTIGESLDAYQAALRAQDEPLEPLEWLGLLGADPQGALSAAAERLRSGDWAQATSDSDAATALRATAADEGTHRAAVGGGSGAVLLSLGAGLVIVRRRRHREAPAAGVSL
jgi:hypothetical protein